MPETVNQVITSGTVNRINKSNRFRWSNTYCVLGDWCVLCAQCIRFLLILMCWYAFILFPSLSLSCSFFFLSLSFKEIKYTLSQSVWCWCGGITYILHTPLSPNSNSIIILYFYSRFSFSLLLFLFARIAWNSAYSKYVCISARMRVSGALLLLLPLLSCLLFV